MDYLSGDLGDSEFSAKMAEDCESPFENARLPPASLRVHCVHVHSGRFKCSLMTGRGLNKREIIKQAVKKWFYNVLNAGG